MWLHRMEELSLPPALLEFPNLVEQLPVWASIGALGWTMGREIGHAVMIAFKEFTEWKLLPGYRNQSAYYQMYEVR